MADDTAVFTLHIYSVSMLMHTLHTTKNTKGKN